MTTVEVYLSRESAIVWIILFLLFYTILHSCNGNRPSQVYGRSNIQCMFESNHTVLLTCFAVGLRMEHLEVQFKFGSGIMYLRGVKSLVKIHFLYKDGFLTLNCHVRNNKKPRFQTLKETSLNYRKMS